MRLGLRIAKRFLKSNPGQTLLIVLGIAIGVSVQIFIGSLIQGLQKSLIEKTIGDSSQITITADTEDKKIYNYEGIKNKLKSYDSRIEKITIANDNPSIINIKEYSQSLLIRGFEIDEADKIFDFKDRIVEGRIPSGEYEIIIGIDLKKEYNLSLNDTIKVTTNEQKIVQCKVVGFFDLQVSAINKSWGITTFETSEKIFSTSNSITSINIQLDEKSAFEADVIAENLQKKVDSNLNVTNWKKENEQLLSGLQGQSVSSIMIQVFVMISVVLGIASVLAITVIQKSKQIGILKAMGINNNSTAFIFLFEGLILGILGAIIGILFGLLLAAVFTQFAVNPDGTPVVNLYIDPVFICISGIIAVMASVVASLIPAKRSSKLNPIDIIRNN
jgi:lipoprotein-releasing system permease protein